MSHLSLTFNCSLINKTNTRHCQHCMYTCTCVFGVALFGLTVHGTLIHAHSIVKITNIDVFVDLNDQN